MVYSWAKGFSHWSLDPRNRILMKLYQDQCSKKGRQEGRKEGKREGRKGEREEEEEKRKARKGEGRRKGGKIKKEGK